METNTLLWILIAICYFASSINIAYHVKSTDSLSHESFFVRFMIIFFWPVVIPAYLITHKAI